MPWQMELRSAPLRELVLRSSELPSATRRLRQIGPPSPIRKLARTRAGLAPRARPGATPASDFVPPADKSAPHTRALSRSESRAAPRGGRASLADSTASTV